MVVAAQPVHPEESASLLSRLCLAWAYPLLARGRISPLELPDLPPLPSSASVARAHNELRALLRAHPREQLAFILARLVRVPLILSGFSALVYLIAQLGVPLLLRELVAAVAANDLQRAIGVSLGIGALTLTSAFTNAHTLLWASRMSHTLRCALVAAVFRCALAAPPVTVESEDAVLPARPDALALLAADTERFLTAMPLLHSAWSTPLLIGISTYFLWSFLGVAAFAGCAVILLALPLNTCVLSRQAQQRKVHAGLADARVRATQESLAGISAVKLAAGEASVAAKLFTARREEVRAIAEQNMLYAFTNAINISLICVACVAMFATYTWLGNTHNAGNTFAALAFFNVIRFPLTNLGMLFSSLSQLIVSIRRMDEFLRGSSSLDDTPVSTLDSPTPVIVMEAARSDDDVARVSLEDASAVVSVSGAPHASPVSSGDAPPVVSSDAALITLRRATFVWPRTATTAPVDEVVKPQQLRQLVLRDVTFELQPGQLLIVAGPIGSGKSSLLLALLGEMPRVCALPPLPPPPKLISPTTCVTFAPQTPWIRNATLRENILFDSSFLEREYCDVLAACGLWTDVEGLGPSRDLTMVGERGVTLSGGQRARVGLARAAYALLHNAATTPSRRGLLLADDALSALDAATAGLVWHHLLSPQGILSSRGIGRVLVTHNLQPLQCADVVLVLENGVTLFMGTPRALAETGDVESTFLRDLASRTSELLRAPLPTPPSLSKGGSASTLGDAAVAFVAEDRSTGVVRMEVWWAWVGEGGWFHTLCVAVLLLFFFAIERASYVGADVWLASWTAAADATTTRSGLASLAGFASGDLASSTNVWLPGYAVLCFSNVVGSTGRMLAVSSIATAASAGLFDRTLWAVLRSPASFFDTTPLGRILSRLSYDVDVLDTNVLPRFANAMASVAWLASAVVVMTAVVPPMAGALLPMLIAYVYLNIFVTSALRELQRLDAVSRSPLAAHVAESIRGAPLLRAFGATPRFVIELDALLCNNARAALCFQDSSRWMSLVLDVGGAGLTTLVGILCSIYSGTLSGGMVGLAVNWSINFTVSLNFNLLATTGMAAAGVAVERLLTYTQLPPEAPLVAGASSCDGGGALVCTVQEVRAEVKAALAASRSCSWPTRGPTVTFSALSVRYRPELPRALEALSFSVPAGSFLTIVGRSGSGKSTIASALFRLVEAEEGSITIDGDDIAHMGLTTVRGSRSVIITQEPTVYSGTLRANLDPLGVCSDEEEVLAALCAVGLDSLFCEGRVGEGGDSKSRLAALSAPVEPASLSMGQRQLLCLARALLRRPTLLVLDEATASCDAVSDALIMRLIREKLPGATVICIAHRLDAVARADLVLVVEAGGCAAFGTPQELLGESDNALSRLVRAAGPAVEGALRAAVEGGR